MAIKANSSGIEGDSLLLFKWNFLNAIALEGSGAVIR